MIILNEKDILGEGTARVVYRHPNDDKKCIKIVMRDKLLLKKKNRGFRGLILPLSRFDPTKSEIAVFRKVERELGKTAFECIPRFYGTVDTNLGEGSVFEKVGDENLQSYIKTNPFNNKMEGKLIAIRDFFIKNEIHFSDWGISNFVVQTNKDQSDYNVFAVDGFEYREFIPISRIPYFSKKLILRRSARMMHKLKKNWITSEE